MKIDDVQFKSIQKSDIFWKNFAFLRSIRINGKFFERC